MDQLDASLKSRTNEAPDISGAVEELNRFKDREMFRIDLRHITGRVDWRGFSRELSDLAEVVIGGTADLAFNEVKRQFGTPRLSDGRDCAWCVCALGKFGARELGYASDVELLFVYESEGLTDGDTSVENAFFFSEVVKTFLTNLRTRREGIFEVDLRLRPYGNGGPLASSVAAFKEYYSNEGDARQFERMALAKLRPVAGDDKLGTAVVQLRNDFVYSGVPMDIENIMHLRRRQASELVPLGQISAKYSLGGLVDLEYFAQACQIASGHNDPSVRVTNTLEAVERLVKGSYLEPQTAERFSETYEFLRRMIDAMRVVRGHAKDLTIPPAESHEFTYLARRLQFESTAHLQRAIQSHMEFAKEIWSAPLLERASDN